jgi:hypothetical protein
MQMPDSKVEYVVNRKVTPIESFTVTLSPSAVLNILNSLAADNHVGAHSSEFRQFAAMKDELKDSGMIL